MSDAGMHDAGSGAGSGGRRGTSDSRHHTQGSDFQTSVARLQRAVDELVSTATDRAGAAIDEASRRLERELDRRQRRAERQARRDGGGGQPQSGRSDEPTRADFGRDRDRPSCRDSSRDPAGGFSAAGRTASWGLYRDLRRARICGVCAGIARYYGVEPWVVRCVAITGLLFFPTIVFPAYLIACFVMDKPPSSVEQRRRARRDGHRRDDHRSPAPELGPRFSPRYSLRNVQDDLTEVELRLRRMETHVTSGQYELQREFNKIDGGRGS